MATCHLVIYYMSTGHLVGGTYVSASVGLVSKLDAGDMEQRLSCTSVYSHSQTADLVLISVHWVSELELTQHEAYLRLIFKEADRQHLLL